MTDLYKIIISAVVAIYSGCMSVVYFKETNYFFFGVALFFAIFNFAYSIYNAVK